MMLYAQSASAVISEIPTSADSKNKCVANGSPVTRQTLRQQEELEKTAIYLADWTLSVAAMEKKGEQTQRETETDRQTDRQTDRETKTQTERQTDKQTDRERETDRQTDKTDRQRQRQTERQRDRQRQRQRDRQRQRENETERLTDLQRLRDTKRYLELGNIDIHRQ